MIKPGDRIYLPLMVIRIEDNRIDAQTISGELIQVKTESLQIMADKEVEPSRETNNDETKISRKAAAGSGKRAGANSGSR